MRNKFSACDELQQAVKYREGLMGKKREWFEWAKF
jgi:hypothetical protein